MANQYSDSHGQSKKRQRDSGIQIMVEHEIKVLKQEQHFI